MSKSDLTKPDMIKHPPHYTRFSFEVIEIIDEVVPYYDSTISGHVQNVIKYLFRAPFKGSLLDDMMKARFYLDHAIDIVQDKIEDDKRLKFIDEIDPRIVKGNKDHFTPFNSFYKCSQERYEPTEDEIDEKVIDEY